MTELSFLVDLLLAHRLPKVTRDAVAQRIKDVEAQLAVQAPYYPQQPRPVVLPPGMAQQSPSTLAALARHPDLLAQMQSKPHPEMDTGGCILPVPLAPQPVTVVAQTPATAAALAHREQTIAAAISGKPEKGRTSPRKF